ncbi:hypothetical protein NM208_g3899 [Fusarium decemcellulare]|uniref:Uncharacterized protein n=1 Tax=Fusarium decemcellulare TaxID=57161 RepID=A0ACC1SMY5_9HYPO|nr:hypothetical protein NM208_g3899 [Fusarium decemcellulare]
MTSIQHEKGANIPPVKIYPDKFSGQVVVVTGGAAGIGEVTGRLFAQQGAQVILFDIDGQKLKSVQDSIRQSGGKVDSRRCDVSNEQEVDMAITWVVDTYKKVDALVNIAGIYPFHSLMGYPSELYHRTVAINLNGSFFLTRAVLPHMQKAGYGRIIHTSSATYSQPEPGLAPYVASKAGVIGLVRATAVEAGPGVTANVVLPGLTETNNIRSAEGSQELFDRVVSKQIIKRKGHPLDLAHSFCFIASPESSFFTGQIFDCSGGETFN